MSVARTDQYVPRLPASENERKDRIRFLKRVLAAWKEEDKEVSLTLKPLTKRTVRNVRNVRMKDYTAKICMDRIIADYIYHLQLSSVETKKESENISRIS